MFHRFTTQADVLTCGWCDVAGLLGHHELPPDLRVSPFGIKPAPPLESLVSPSYSFDVLDPPPPCAFVLGIYMRGQIIWRPESHHSAALCSPMRLSHVSSSLIVSPL